MPTSRPTSSACSKPARTAARSEGGLDADPRRRHLGRQEAPAPCRRPGAGHRADARRRARLSRRRDADLGREQGARTGGIQARGIGPEVLRATARGGPGRRVRTRRRRAHVHEAGLTVRRAP